MTEPPPPATASNLNDENDSITLARKVQAVLQLTEIFGFGTAAAEEAVETLYVPGQDIDLTACYDFILDAGLGQDQGGYVTPITNCPHADLHCCITMEQLPLQPVQATCTYQRTVTSPDLTNTGRPKEDANGVEVGDQSCPSTENWLCLECGVVRCSRYTNGHALQHWQETCSDLSSIAESPKIDGHCLAVGLSDLSVWCHVCQAYLATQCYLQLNNICQQLEAFKFHVVPTIELEPVTKRQKSETSMDESDDVGLSDNKENVTSAERSEESDYNSSDEDNDERMERIIAVAASQGIPIEWILRHALEADDGNDDDDNEPLVYPFESPPKSLEDVANFIISDKCKSIVVLAGAGMSVASGIPDFRSADGLYATLNPDLLTANDSEREAIRADPTVSLDQQLFLQNPLPMLELQREFILGTREQRWKATLAHRFVELLHCKTGKLKRLYTQNIDGLEDQCIKLPQEKVIAVHGSMDRAECGRCGIKATIDDFADKVQKQIKDLSGNDVSAPSISTAIECTVCGYGAMKPSIVLFRSSLPKVFFESVPNDIKDVDLLIIIGTSLRVSPANSLVWRAPKTAMRMLVNREEAGEHLGLLFNVERPSRDFLALGECEEQLLKLMELLGWIDELVPYLQNRQLPESSAKLLQNKLTDAGNPNTMSQQYSCDEIKYL